jgi:hypothetical protein
MRASKRAGGEGCRDRGCPRMWPDDIDRRRDRFTEHLPARRIGGEARKLVFIHSLMQRERPPPPAGPPMQHPRSSRASGTGIAHDVMHVRGRVQVLTG